MILKDTQVKSTACIQLAFLGTSSLCLQHVSKNFAFISQGGRSDKIKRITVIPAIAVGNNTNYLFRLVFSYPFPCHKKTQLLHTTFLNTP